MIGASRRRGSIGGELFRNILAADFAGAAYPVNRGGEPVAGVRALRLDRGDPGRGRPRGHLRARRAACSTRPRRRSRKGVRALCVISAGFAETGAEGRERQERLLALVRAHGARLVGPNCLGIAVVAAAAERDLRAARAAARADRLLVAERRARARAARAGVERGSASRPSSRSGTRPTSPRTTCSSGGRTTRRPTSCCSTSSRSATRASSRASPAASRAASRSSRSRPARRRAGARAASSHTAALAGSEAAVDALFRQAGVLRARTLEELVDAAGAALEPAAAARPPRRRAHERRRARDPLRRRLRGGRARAAGARRGDARGARRACCRPRRASRTRSTCSARRRRPTYERALPPLLADPRVDALIVLFVPPVVAGARRRSPPRSRGRSRQRRRDKPVLAVVMSAEGTPAALRRGRGVAAFAYPESAARALGLAAERAEWLRRPAGTVPELDGIDTRRRASDRRRGARGSSEGWLDAGAGTRALLEAYGDPASSPSASPATADEAVAAARRARLPGRRQDRGRRRAQDRERRRRARPARRGAGARGGRSGSARR